MIVLSGCRFANLFFPNVNTFLSRTKLRYDQSRKNAHVTVGPMPLIARTSSVPFVDSDKGDVAFVL